MIKPIITKKTAIEFDGDILLPFEYDDIRRAIVDGKESNSVFITKKGHELGIVKIFDDGDYKEEEEFHSVGDFIDGVAIVSYYDERFGEKFILAKVTDDDLIVLGLPKYDSIERLHDGLYKVREEAKYGVLDSEGNLIISCLFSKIEYNIEKNSFYLE